MTERSAVTIFLVDKPSASQDSFQLLKFKYECQLYGKLLYFIRQERSYEFFPIEFAKEKSMIVDNLRHDPEHMYHDLIDPSLKLDLDVYFEYLLYSVNQQESFGQEKEMLELRFMDSEYVMRFMKNRGCELPETQLSRLLWFFPSVRTIAFENRENFLEVVKFDGSFVKDVNLLLSYVSEDLKSDRSIIIECLKQSGFSLHWTSAELKNDRELVLQAVKTDGLVLKELETSWVNDRDIVKAALQQNGNVIAIAPVEMKMDREIISVALKSNCNSLEYLPDEMKNNKEVVMEAVRQDNNPMFCQSPLKYASDLLRKDPEVVFEAVAKNPMSIQYAKYLNKEILTSAIRRKPMILEYLPAEFAYLSKEILEDRDFVMEIIEIKMEDRFALYRHLPRKRYNEDRELCLKLLKSNPQNYGGLPWLLKLEKEYAMLANTYIFVWSDNVPTFDLWEDRDVYLEHIKRDHKVLWRSPHKDDDRFIKEAIQANPLVLHKKPEFAKKEPELTMEAIKRNGCALSEEFASEELEIEAVKSNGFYLKFSENLYQERLNSEFYGAKVSNFIFKN